MTDNEIIKAIEYCLDSSNETCEFCPFRVYCQRDSKILKCALDIIYRQTAEIEQLKRNLEQCENGYRQQIHLLQCKSEDEKRKLCAEIEQLTRKYNLSVAEREANVKGFTEQLSRVKTAVAQEIFAEIEKIIQKNYDSAQNNEEDEELEAATGYLSYVSCDLDELKEKYTGANDESKT